MSDGSGIFVDFIIVASDKSLITEEVNSLVFDAGDTFLGFNVLQTVSLVPTGGEDVKGDLATDGVTNAFGQYEPLEKR